MNADFRFPNGDSHKLAALDATTKHIMAHMEFLSHQQPQPPSEPGAAPQQDQTQPTATDLGITPMLAPENQTTEQAGSSMPRLLASLAPQAGPLGVHNNAQGV
jgi:hypothetical protein